MWRKRCFLTCLTIALLVSFTIQPLFPYDFSVPPTSASPDSYSDSISFVSFTVEGAATFVNKEESGGSFAFYFVTPSEGEIEITASTQARAGYLNIAIQIMQPLWRAKRLDEASGYDVGLSVSSSLRINESFYEVWLPSSYSSAGDVDIHLGFYAKPTIWLNVNDTTVTLGDGVKIYGERKPKDVLNPVPLSLIYEGGLYAAANATYDADILTLEGWFDQILGTFYYAFYPPYIGKWTAIAEVSTASAGVPADLVTNTASVNFTVTSEAQPTQPPTPKKPDIFDVLSPQLIRIIFIGLALLSASLAAAFWIKYRKKLKLPPPPARVSLTSLSADRTGRSATVFLTV